MGKRKIVDCGVALLIISLGCVNCQPYYYSNNFQTGHQEQEFPASTNGFSETIQTQFQPEFQSFQQQTFTPLQQTQQAFLDRIQPAQQQQVFERIQPGQQQGQVQFNQFQQPQGRDLFNQFQRQQAPDQFNQFQQQQGPDQFNQFQQQQGPDQFNQFQQPQSRDQINQFQQPQGRDQFNQFQQQQGRDQLQSFQQQPSLTNAGTGFSQSSVSGSSNVNVAGNRGRPQNRSTTRGRARGFIDDDLQAQFQEIFNWNLDLANDTRFRECVVPDIGDVSRACPKRAFYFGLNPQHRRAVGMVKSILTQPNNPQQTVCLAGAMRDLAGMNPNVWIRGMLGAHLSDVGLFDLRVPPMVEVMPHIFLTNDVLQEAKAQGARGPAQRSCLVIDGSAGRDNGIENRLWYFREDVQVNSFHLNWHLVYPFTGITRRADRSGELFYFTHRSHLARYHAERLSNGLGAIAPLDIDTNVAVPERFNPHLNDSNSGMMWAARRPNAVLQDAVFIAIAGVPPNISIADRSLHVRRVQEAINDRALRLPNGQFLPLNVFEGIDILGHVVEASIFSPNPDYYGMFGFHNEGHVLLSLIENPQNLTSLPPGVMLEVATAMRDPVFYTYHTSMNNVFDLYKQALYPYQPIRGVYPLRWQGIEISHLQVVSDAETGGTPNVLNTFLNSRTFELSRGLDFNRSGIQGSIPACVTHLDHTGFSYQIDVNRRRDVSTDRATVRIFLAPRFDEFGRRYTMREQRNWFFMLDLFTISLSRVGRNRIVRHSSESSLTIDIPESSNPPDPTANLGQRQYCGCGWPRHMLLPKGTENGLTFDLFVMITNGWEDYVAPTRTNATQNECNPAPIYCGRLNDTYPDARPMGYPFDRLPYNNVRDLDEYTRIASNMAYVPIVIRHNPRPPTRQQQPVAQPPRDSDGGVTRDYYFNPNTGMYERPIPGVVPTRRTPVQFQEDRTPEVSQNPRTQFGQQQQQPSQTSTSSDASVTRDYYFNPDTGTYERPVPGVVPSRRTPVQFQEDRTPAFSFPDQFFRGFGRNFGQQQQEEPQQQQQPQLQNPQQQSSRSTSFFTNNYSSYQTFA